MYIELEVPSAGAIMPFEEIEKISAIAKKNKLFMHLGNIRDYHNKLHLIIPKTELDYGTLV